MVEVLLKLNHLIRVNFPKVCDLRSQTWPRFWSSMLGILSLEG